MGFEVMGFNLEDAFSHISNFKMWSHLWFVAL